MFFRLVFNYIKCFSSGVSQSNFFRFAVDRSLPPPSLVSFTPFRLYFDFIRSIRRSSARSFASNVWESINSCNGQAQSIDCTPPRQNGTDTEWYYGGLHFGGSVHSRNFQFYSQFYYNSTLYALQIYMHFWVRTTSLSWIASISLFSLHSCIRSHCWLIQWPVQHCIVFILSLASSRLSSLSLTFSSFGRFFYGFLLALCVGLYLLVEIDVVGSVIQQANDVIDDDNKK